MTSLFAMPSDPATHQGLRSHEGRPGRRARRGGCVALASIVAAVSGLAWSSVALAAAGAAESVAQPEGANPADGAAPPRLAPAPELAVFEGRAISRVTVLSRVLPEPGAAALAPEAAPAPPEIALLVRNNIRLKDPAPFEGALVAEDLGRLNRLGRFQEVRASAQLLADGSVELIYDLVLQPLIEDIQPVGNTVLSDQEILAEAGFLVRTPFDAVQLDRVARRIEDRYRRKGFFNVAVAIDQSELAGTGIVILRVREGERTRVTDIRFEGVTAFTDRELENQVRTRTSSLLDLLDRERSAVDEDRLAEDVGTVIQYYKDRGYLDARADRVITPSPNGREAIITFVVDEGPIYTMREVRLEIAGQAGGQGGGEAGEAGAEGAAAATGGIFTPEQLTGLLAIKAGDVYSDRLVRQSVDAVRDAYGKMGFVDARIVRRQLRSPDQPLVDLLLIVEEGRRFEAGVVDIQGNRITRDDVVRRYVTVQPGRPLDATAVRDSEDRLRRSRLFAPPSADVPGPKVTVQPEREDNPGVRDVIVEVDETNTGSFNIGAAVSSDSGVIGQIQLTQRNFDITDTPESWGDLFSGESFRGGGQTFNIAILPGDQINRFEVSLSEPSLFDTDFTSSGAAYFFTREYRSYREQRYGGRYALGRRIGDRWNIQLPTRLENINLPEIDADAPRDYFAVEDDRVHASVGIQLQRSTLDDPIFPGKGTRAQVGIDQTFLDSTFNVISGEYVRIFSLDEDVLGRKTTLQLTTSASYIPQDAADVPFYDRLYLGGQSFRGFAFRGVSPVGIRNDNGQVGDDPIGGNFRFFAGAEVKFPIYERILQGVVFLDTGTVREDIGFGEYRASVGFGLRLFIEQLGPVPFALDFGFPIMDEETDRTRVFTFSIDVPLQ